MFLLKGWKKTANLMESMNAKGYRKKSMRNRPHTVSREELTLVNQIIFDED